MRIIKTIAAHRLEIISFGTGFALMTFELAAARVLAPSIGSSMYVWTSVIGVIIAALSFGFFVGGRVADFRGYARDIVWILIAASLAIAITMMSYKDVLDWVASTFTDGRIQGVIAASILFAPTSFLIGLTSPYLAKRKIQSLELTGRSIASLDACNALGGIIGTFVTGFFLFGFVGAHETFLCVSVLLFSMSWLFVPRTNTTARLLATGAIGLLLLVPLSYTKNTISIDSVSAHYEIIDATTSYGELRGLQTGPRGVQSAVYRDGRSDLVFWYTQEIARIAVERKPRSILVLGGGAFTLPQYLAENLPNSKIDVVEIDPALEAISTQYFGYNHPVNIQLFFEDARTYINQSSTKYDLIVVDVYGDTMIPFTFMTAEYGQAIAQRLNDGGMILANIVAGQSGACKKIFSAINAAYASELPNVQYRTEQTGQTRGNYIVAYTHNYQPIPSYTSVPLNRTQPYIDNFAPAERLYFDCIEQLN